MNTSGVPLDSIKTVACEGTFDLLSCVRVLEAIRDADGTFEIDVHRVSEFSDAALPLLAEALSGAVPGHLVVRGLGEHQRKVLDYLGVHAETYEPHVERKVVDGRESDRLLGESVNALLSSSCSDAQH